MVDDKPSGHQIDFTPKPTFVSYSRRNTAFAQKLVAALRDAGREAWIDWEGIPLTVDFWREITQAIEAADTFLCIVTSEWLASPTCNLELAYARRWKKRVVPVMLAKPDVSAALGILAAAPLDDNTRQRLEGRDIVAVARDNWNQVSLLNWTDFGKIAPDDAAAFDKLVEELVETMEADLDYVREHTRLFVKARDWEKNARNPSFLLRDDELKLALDWQQSATTRNAEPALTDLHLEYLKTSAHDQSVRDADAEATRKRTRNLQRSAFFLGLVVVLASVSTVIAGLLAADASRQVVSAQASLTPIPATVGAAQTAAQQAVQQADAARTLVSITGATLTPIGATLTAFTEQVAREQSRIASLRMASAAEAVMQDPVSDPQVAALLAAHGLRLAYTEQADAALVKAQSLMSNRTCLFANPVVTSMAFSPDGKILLTTDDSPAARLWDARTGKMLRELKQSEPTRNAYFSADGTQVLTIGENGDKGSVHLFSVESGQERQSFAVDFPNSSAVLSPDGKTLLTTGWGDNQSGGAWLWDVETGKQRQPLEPNASIYYGEFSRDGAFVLTEGTATVVWDVRTGQQINRIDTAGGDSTFSPDGSAILTSTADGLTLWRVKDGSHIMDFTPGEGVSIGQIHRGTFSRDGTMVAVGNELNKPYVWKTSTGQLVKEPWIEGASGAPVFSQDGKIILMVTHSVEGPTPNTAVLTSLSGEFRPFTISYPGPITTSLAPDGSAVLINDDTRVCLWRVPDFITADTLYQSITADQYVYSVDAKAILTTEYDNLKLWDSRTGMLRQTAPREGVGLAHLSFSPDGKMILLQSQMEVSLLDARDLREAHKFSLAPMINISASFKQDGKQLLIVKGNDANSPADAQLFDTDSGELLAHYNIAGQSVVQISPSGKYIVTTAPPSKDKAVSPWQLWNLETNQKIILVPSPMFVNGFAAFSPEEDTLLISGADQVTSGASTKQSISVYLFDTRTGKQRRVLRENGISDQDYSANRAVVALLTEDHALRVWDTVTDSITSPLPSIQSLQRIALSPDGKTVAFATDNGAISLVNADGSGKIRQISTDLQYSFAFSPDSRLVGTIDSPGTVRLYLVEDGSPYRTLTLPDPLQGSQLMAGQGPALEFQFSPDSNTLIVARNGFGIVPDLRLWTVGIEDYLSVVCNHFSRDLTTTERARYGLTDNEAVCPGTF